MDQLRRLRLALNPLRLQVLKRLLQNGDSTPKDLAYWFGVEESKMNHHLLKLRSIGLLESYHLGKNSFYRVTKPALVADLLQFVGEWEDKHEHI